jgi:PAS domain S-box-containing protein
MKSRLEKSPLLSPEEAIELNIKKLYLIYFNYMRMKKTFIKTLLLILSVEIIPLLSLTLPAHNPVIKFQRLTIENGLSQSSIFCILQDRRGFMWFGTEDGLNKYDGYRFKIYRNNPENLNSISYNNIKAIHEDRSGILWFGTYGGGLNRFDQEKEQFDHYQANPADPKSLSNNFVTAICEDRSGNLWIGTENGLNMLIPSANDESSATFTTYNANPSDPNSLSADRIKSIYEDSTGALWIGTYGGGLNRFDQEKEHFDRYQANPKDPKSLSDNFVNAICEDSSGNLWIGTENGLNMFIRNKSGESVLSFAHFQSDSDDLSSLSDKFVNAIWKDRTGTLWIGTKNGLNKLVSVEKDGSSPVFTQFKNDPNDPNSLGYNEIFSINEDRAGVLWIGTHAGLNKLDQERKAFLLYRSKPNDPHSLSHNYVYSIWKDKSGVLWIGTQGGGLNKFDRQKGQYIHYRADPSDPTSLSSSWIRTIYEDSSGTLWIGTLEGLNKLVPGKKEDSPPTFIHYKADSDRLDSLSNNVVRTIIEDHRGILWVGTEDELNRFDREREKFTRYRNDPDNPRSLSNNFIYSVCEDSLGTLWVGTLDGLNKLVPSKEEGSPPLFVHYKAEPDNPSSISNSEVLSIYEDQSGVLWIGTPGGLNKFDRKKESFSYYTEKNGLPNDLIYNIVEDDNGNLWLSTNKGLSLFDPRQERFKNYDVKDGLQSNEFNLGACYKGSDGEIFFGGINGFNSFYPEDIYDNPHVPAVVITEFQIFNKPLPIGEGPDGRSILKKSITETQDIVLSHKDRVLSFEFTALHFASPEKNEYAYKMEGFEKDWNYVGNRRFVTYTNLPPGHYVFRVKGSNNDGIWNEEGASLKISITPPLWQTWWFRGIITITILLLFYSIYEIRTKSIRERSKELENRVGERTAELKAANQELQQEIVVRERAETALQAGKAYLDQLFENAQEAIVMVDNDHRVLRVNNEFSRLFGYNPQEAEGQLIDALVSSNETEREAAFYTEQLTGGKKIAFESVRRCKDGTLIHVSAIGSPIIIDGSKQGYYAIYRDITERKRAEENVKRRAAQAALIYEIGERISRKLKLKELFSEIVAAVKEAFSYRSVSLFLVDESSKQLIMQSISGGNKDFSLPRSRLDIGVGMTGYAAASGKTQISNDVSKDPHYVCFGTKKTKSEIAVPIRSGDKVIGVFDIQCDKLDAFDETDVKALETLSTQIATAIENARLYEKAQQEISERKKAESQLSESLKEKEVLLKEIHHRVKNNMQVISSLLRLQSWQIRDEKMQEIFKGCQDRITSMALIHEKLYQSDDLARIDFAEYVRSLTNNLFSMYRSGMDAVEIKLDMDKFYLDINTAIPLGLIVNELVSNSLKYAFPEKGEGGQERETKDEIGISLCCENKGRVALVVRDNGVGLPPAFDYRKSESLGLQLVTDLVDQLDGSIKLEGKKGTAFIITFAVPK